MRVQQNAGGVVWALCSSAVLAALLGCAGTPPTAQDAGTGGSGATAFDVSGTRLRVRYILGDDGSRTASGFHDSKLGFDCGFVQTADAGLRCAPLGSPVGDPSSWVSGAFQTD